MPCLQIVLFKNIKFSFLLKCILNRTIYVAVTTLISKLKVTKKYKQIFNSPKMVYQARFFKGVVYQDFYPFRKFLFRKVLSIVALCRAKGLLRKFATVRNRHYLHGHKLLQQLYFQSWSEAQSPPLCEL